MAAPMRPAHSGASFLTTPVASAEVFAPEVFSDEQRMMANTARAFVHGEVMPLAERIDLQELAAGDVEHRLVRQGAGLRRVAVEHVQDVVFVDQWPA